MKKEYQSHNIPHSRDALLSLSYFSSELFTNNEVSQAAAARESTDREMTKHTMPVFHLGEHQQPHLGKPFIKQQKAKNSYNPNKHARGNLKLSLLDICKEIIASDDEHPRTIKKPPSSTAHMTFDLPDTSLLPNVSSSPLPISPEVYTLSSEAPWILDGFVPGYLSEYPLLGKRQPQKDTCEDFYHVPSIDAWCLT